jgi:site-specific recombinase XerD
VSELTRIEAAMPAEIDAGTLANLERHAAAARGAYAGNTERALRADVAIYTAWCSGSGRTALPASAETVAAFIDAMGTQKAPATVRRYVSSVSTFHRAAGVPNPCETLAVKLALKRMHRERGRGQEQAAPVNDVLVARMLAGSGNTLRHMRDRALLAVAYSTLCRRSEMVELLREDLQVDADGFGTITIRRSKTDQEGVGAVAPIAPDAMRHLSVWIEAAGVTAGPMFRAVLKGGRVGEALGTGDVARIYKAMAKAARLTDEEIARISGHSTRVGAAQDMVRYGVDLAGAMQAGRWKTSAMVARYSARLMAKRGGMAQIADRRVQF